ncbi:hypothetical protein G9C98_003835 [Cotesia typhae]|uniref:SBF1/SBF2 domain-containing protein n=1 Tax=Cotesia typhae TaxID=2053667 RepID=A0A8J5V8A2_9HYME|nr:hypothetical protein G9C98_003835 [Cotesia typhae]
MVDVTTNLPSSNGTTLMGRTKGALKTMRTALGGGGEYLQGLGSRIGSALSSSFEDSEVTTPSSPPSPHLNDQNTSRNEGTARRKLRFPRPGGGFSYEDYEAMTRHKLEREACTRSRRKYPAGMTYEEIASSRTSVENKNPMQVEQDISPDRDSIESIEPLQEKDIRATGPDPYDKLDYKIDVPCSSGSASDQDGYGPKAAADFMKTFVPMLFDAPESIDQEQKASFGQMVLTESGRIWFSRVVNARRARACVSEASFYSLAQHFAVALFECHEADDFAPAKNLMNMCFTFYHEVEVPGLEPYREYLYTHLRVQPIWRSMRFWTAAFFDAVQCERAARPVPSRSKSLNRETIAAEDRKYQANIVFGQLGTFTCNMHAFGLSRNLCLEFLRKQCVIANLTAEQEKMLRDNIMRMFDESEPWR